jgi:predicted CxxxxCH...CXXCH cytochrome family protein
MHLNRIILLAAIFAAATLSACDTARPVEDGPSGAGGLHADGYAAGDHHGADAVTDLATCKGCHGETLDGGVAPSCNDCHQDHGYANWQSNCTFCHGARQATYAAEADLSKAAPPQGVHGETSATDPHVGAHQKHLGNGSVLSNGFACTTCHDVPTTLGHIDGAATLTFGALAKTGGLSPAVAAGKCSSVYCHGSASPTWTGTVSCGDCHAVPSTSGKHSTHTGVACSKCHPGYAATSVNEALHVDGKYDVSIVTPGSGTVTFSAWPSGCACHSAPYNVPMN